MYSRDVKFNEMELGLGSGESSDYVELDVSSPTDEVQEDEVQEGELREDSEVGEGAATEQNVEESGVRRSTRNQQRPDYLVEKVSVAKDSAEEPATVKETLESPQHAEWKEAMEAEMQSLQGNDVWELVELPEDRKPVGSRWVFKMKRNEHGEVERYKARLVAQGFSRL